VALATKRRLIDLRLLIDVDRAKQRRLQRRLDKRYFARNAIPKMSG